MRGALLGAIGPIVPAIFPLNLVAIRYKICPAQAESAGLPAVAGKSLAGD